MIPENTLISIKNVIPENTLSEEAKNELNKIKEIEQIVDREKLYYRANKHFSEQKILLVEIFITVQLL